MQTRFTRRQHPETTVGGVDATFVAMPCFPHYAPDDPWMALDAAKIPNIPATLSADVL